MLAGFVRDETGATALEYALIVAILAAAIVGGLGDVMQTISDKLQAAAEVMKERTAGP